MEISVDTIKELRELTSCGVIECKNALEEVEGDINKAKEILKQRGLEIAAKKGSRTAKEGRIEAYVHAGAKIGVIVEVNCETDFVAQNENFTAFVKDIAMHIAAANPTYISKEDVPQDVLSSKEDAAAYISEACLLEQSYVKDSKLTVQEYLNNMIASIGENISIGRFIRYKVNEVV